LEFSIPLNKFEKKQMVIELHLKSKNYREIAKLVHISFRDIKQIIKAYEKKVELQKKKDENNQQSTTKKLSLSSRAFKLFSDGKSSTEVVIELDIQPEKVERLWHQFLKSERMEDCYEFFQEFQYDIPILLSINNFMKRNNVSAKNIVNILRTANDVINLNQRISNLKAEIEKLEQMKKDYSSQILPPMQPLPRHPSSWNDYHY
jgi:hypothetical protein